MLGKGPDVGGNNGVQQGRQNGEGETENNQERGGGLPVVKKVAYLGGNRFKVNKRPTAKNVDFSVLGGNKPSISSETL